MVELFDVYPKDIKFNYIFFILSLSLLYNILPNKSNPTKNVMN